MSKLNIVEGMIVRGTYERVLSPRLPNEKPKFVLVRLKEVVGHVAKDEATGDETITMYPQPKPLADNIIGKQWVGDLNGDEASERDELMEAMVEAERDGVLKKSDPVTLEVLQVEKFDGRPPVIKLSEAAYERRKARGNLKKGDKLTVKVKEKVPFGVFVELTKYEDALLHRDQIVRGKRFEPGDEVEVVIIEKRPHDTRKGQLRWGVSQIEVGRQQQREQEAARLAREEAARVEAAKAAEQQAERREKLLASLEPGTVGQVKVVRAAADGLHVLFEDLPAFVPDAKLVFPKASVSSTGTRFSAFVVSVDKEKREVILGTKAKVKPAKK